ncbi:hypothetical protein PIB30_097091 [Stylosanthes scabra]|uniref:Uncharacterized protein n=1 Tax=Stylosanthes scabra TaxID=79078 RepID=A0ABU6XSZ4_9FABA|nr:hypothetical protein [Stylosanthes scabra]
MEYGRGSGSQPGDWGPPSHRYGPPSDMYVLFLCEEQTLDQIVHGYVTSRPTDDAVYRPSPPLQPHPDHSQPCEGFQYYQPSPQSFLRTSPQQQYQLPSSHCQTYYQPSPQPSYPSPSWAQPHYQSIVSYHSPSPQPQHDDQAHQVVCRPPTCGTSSHLHHRPAHEGDRDKVGRDSIVYCFVSCICWTVV